MSDVTQILADMTGGASNRLGTEQLLPLVYQELRRLAEQRLARETEPQTLQATALVHEAYMRLVGPTDVGWDGRGHFFGAAAEAMRRVLVEHARRRQAAKRGGHLARVELGEASPAEPSVHVDRILDLEAALAKLDQQDCELAQIVKLRYFAGLSVDQVAKAQNCSPRTVKRQWAYARAWLGRELQRGGDE